MAEETKVETTEAPAEEKKVELSGKVADIIGTIEGMTVLEMADLVKALEDKFGVTAAAPVAMAAAPAAGGGGDAAEEKTEFDVILADTGEKKFQVVKVIRQMTDLGLKEAKELVDNPGQAIKKELSKEEADEMKKKLEEAGAKVELK